MGPDSVTRWSRWGVPACSGQVPARLTRRRPHTHFLRRRSTSKFQGWKVHMCRPPGRICVIAMNRAVFRRMLTSWNRFHTSMQNKIRQYVSDMQNYTLKRRQVGRRSDTNFQPYYSAAVQCSSSLLISKQTICNNKRENKLFQCNNMSKIIKYKYTTIQVMLNGTVDRREMRRNSPLELNHPELLLSGWVITINGDGGCGRQQPTGRYRFLWCWD